MSYIAQNTDVLSLFFDEESKFIFSCRERYRKTGSYQPVAEMCDALYQKKVSISLAKQLQNYHNIVAFGCGAIGQRTAETLRYMGIPLHFFCDNAAEKHGGQIQGVPVISPDSLLHLKGKTCIIITTSIPTYMDEIRLQLQSMGIAEENIIAPCQVLGTQYFDLQPLSFQEKEIFVDAGCFNGDDCVRFIRKTNGRYRHIYAFEPDQVNHEVCRKKLGHCPDLTLYPYALWSNDGLLPFAENQWGSSHVESCCSSQTSSVSLDQLLSDASITYIKMDIEGAELQALHGASRLITKQQPKLAICVYHKADDIYEIPLFLQSIVPQYQFYLRHYSLCDLETVLYAVPQKV